jgi:hypothetical protein
MLIASSPTSKHDARRQGQGKTKKVLDPAGLWPVQSGYGEKTVDVLVCARGCWIGIECKKAGVTKPTPRQAETMRQMREAGAKTYLVTADKDGNLVWIEQCTAP